MRLKPALTLLGLVLAGCSDDNPVKTAAPETVQKRAWIGSYASGSGSSDVVMDLDQTGTSLRGELAYGPTTLAWFHVTGEIHSDSMFLTNDPAYGPVSDFSLRVQIHQDDSLSGTMRSVPGGLDADVACRPLPRLSVDTDVSHDVPFTVISAAYDDTLMWLGTVGDNYVRIEPTGAVVDTVAVDHAPSAHWVSDVLMFDGTVMWGVYPIALNGPGGVTNVADLLGFNASGRTADSMYVAFRPAGLATDGSRFWSLHGEPPGLVSFDRRGAVTDSLHLEAPDASQLAF
ncbi:MAG: hypothetical protein ACRENN_09340, partial [Candidatus Eiseniibacteriota bacterium]